MVLIKSTDLLNVVPMSNWLELAHSEILSQYFLEDKCRSPSPTLEVNHEVPATPERPSEIEVFSKRHDAGIGKINTEPQTLDTLKWFPNRAEAEFDCNKEELCDVAIKMEYPEELPVGLALKVERSDQLRPNGSKEARKEEADVTNFGVLPTLLELLDEKEKFLTERAKQLDVGKRELNYQISEFQRNKLVAVDRILQRELDMDYVRDQVVHKVQSVQWLMDLVRNNEQKRISASKPADPTPSQLGDSWEKLRKIRDGLAAERTALEALKAEIRSDITEILEQKQRDHQ